MPSLTIEGETYYLTADKWFYFDGTLSTVPVWFIDILEDHIYHKLQDSIVINYWNGQTTIHYNSLVLYKRLTVAGLDVFDLQSIRGVSPHAQKE